MSRPDDISKSLKHRHWMKANERAQAEEGLAYTLGLIVLVGMLELEAVRAFTGDGLEHVYKTSFTMDDGHDWELRLTRLEATNAR